MDQSLYEMIFKRKSFHLFPSTGEERISEEELTQIRDGWGELEPLEPGIKTAMQIIPAERTSCSRGQEYCILLYSEKKGNYLQNIGYAGEQLDLYLASMNIGALWYGIGRVQEPKYQDLDFVIMIAVKKVQKDKFRKDMFKSRRKTAEEIWSGPQIKNVTDIVRFAPSACNTQPWLVENHDGQISVYRYKKPGKRGIMPADRVAYYNRIDVGIFLLFLELCLQHEKIVYERSVYDDDGEGEKTLAASFDIR